MTTTHYRLTRNLKTAAARQLARIGVDAAVRFWQLRAEDARRDGDADLARIFDKAAAWVATKEAEDLAWASAARAGLAPWRNA